jgi:uncharacterized membrane protein YkoI
MLTGNRTVLPGIILLFAGYALPATAGHDHATLEECLDAASQIKPGEFVKVEYLIFSSDGMQAYEIEVRDRDGNDWELMCDAERGFIVEIEREVDSPDHELFKPRMKVTEADARKTALAMYPGNVKKVEYEIEFDGEPVYEYDIIDSEGVEWKVEVSAESGKIKEVAVEAWQIGLEKR